MGNGYTFRVEGGWGEGERGNYQKLFLLFFLKEVYSREQMLSFQSRQKKEKVYLFSEMNWCTEMQTGSLKYSPL